MPTREELKVGQEERIRAYYQAISAKGKEVMKEKRARGEIMHKAPLGYKNARDEHGRSVLLIDHDEMMIVEEVLKQCREGQSLRNISARLATCGVKTRSGKHPSAMYVKRILTQWGHRN